MWRLPYPIAFIISLFLVSVCLADFPSNPESRKISLDGTRNARDLGGLPVASGFFPKNKVIRSGALCFASKKDAEKLLSMKLHTIIELRLDNEIKKDGPDKPYLTKGVTNLLHWPMAGSRGPGLAAYESYTEENGPLFRDFFALLAKPDSYPVLFHCSAGKDRTGILAALLLDFLGTPRTIIYDDYLHSMRITPALKVHKEWLDAVFERVDAAGGIEAFLTKCGVTQEQKQAVRANLGSK